MAGIAAAVGIVPARARVHAPTRSASIAFPLHSGASDKSKRMLPAGRTIVSASFGDPGYWDDVVSLMTPDVNVNLGPGMEESEGPEGSRDFHPPILAFRR